MSEKTLDVLCVGNAIVDVISQADESFLAAHGMVKGSMQLIDDTAAHALYAAMGAGQETSGGAAANTAAGFASFEGKAGFIGKVADDQLGEVFAHDIRAAGVAYEPIVMAGGLPTGRCLILVTPDAQRTLNTHLGVAGLLAPGDIDEGLVATAQVVYCEGYLWDLPDAKAALAKAMDAARAAGSTVAFTLSDSFCVDRHRAEFLDLAEHRIDILFANEDEICSLYETSSFDEAAKRVGEHCEIACLTRSEKGSTVVAGGEQIHVAAAPVDELVDTTGAGDLFAAGFLFGHTHGRDLEASARLGSIAAAEVISHLGARPLVHLRDLAEGS